MPNSSINLNVADRNQPPQPMEMERTSTQFNQQNVQFKDLTALGCSSSCLLFSGAFLTGVGTPGFAPMPAVAQGLAIAGAASCCLSTGVCVFWFYDIQCEYPKAKLVSVLETARVSNNNTLSLT